MVLAALGQPMAEDVLRVVTDCSPLGTDAFQLVEAARQLGFPASRKYTLASLDELGTLLVGIVKLTHHEALIRYRGRGTALHSPFTPPLPCR
jgi:hypothetical protein